MDQHFPSSPAALRNRAPIAAVLRDAVPGAAVVPYVSPNDTDSKHCADLADEQIRFLPVTLRAADLGLIHGTDERIAVAAYVRLIDCYRRLIRAFDATAEDAA